MKSACRVAYAAPVPNYFRPNWKLAQPLDRVKNIAFGSVYVSGMPSKTNFVIIENRTFANPQKLKNNWLLCSLVLPLRDFVIIPSIKFFRHCFRRFRAAVVGISFAKVVWWGSHANFSRFFFKSFQNSQTFPQINSSVFEFLLFKRCHSVVNAVVRDYPQTTFHNVARSSASSGSCRHKSLTRLWA